MSKIKGTDLNYIKKLVKSKYANKEDAILAKLDKECQDIYQHVLASLQYPIDPVAKIYEAAAECLFPGSAKGVQQLFSEVANQTYSGIYSIFLRIPSIPFVLKQTATIWKSYYDTGTAKIENLLDHSLDLVVTEFPNLPKAMREATTAHIRVLISKTGAKNLRVDGNYSNPLHWSWHVSWE